MKIECIDREVIIPAEEVGPTYRQDEQSVLRKKVSLVNYEVLLQEEQDKICHDACGGGSDCLARKIGNTRMKDNIVAKVNTKVNDVSN